MKPRKEQKKKTLITLYSVWRFCAFKRTRKKTSRRKEEKGCQFVNANEKFVFRTSLKNCIPTADIAELYTLFTLVHTTHILHNKLYDRCTLNTL